MRVRALAPLTRSPTHSITHSLTHSLTHSHPTSVQIRTDISVTGVNDAGDEFLIVPYSTVSRRVKCPDRVSPFCRNFTVFAESAVEFDSYNLKVKVYHPKELYCKTWANGGRATTGLQFTMRYINSEFTSMEVGFKYLFVFLSIIAFVAYAFMMNKLGRHKSYEQKWIDVLLGLLILYVDAEGRSGKGGSMEETKRRDQCWPCVIL